MSKKKEVKTYVMNCQNPKCGHELYALAVIDYNKGNTPCYLCGKTLMEVEDDQYRERMRLH